MDDLETKTEQESQTLSVSFEDALQIADRAYPKLSDEGKQRLARQLQENPEQYCALAHALPEVTPKEISARLEKFREVLDDAKAGIDKAWMPDNPSKLYTDAERTQLKIRQFGETYLGFLIGTDHTARLETKLAPLVRDRNKERLMTDLEKGVGELETMTTSIETLRDRTEERMRTLVDDVLFQDTQIGIAEMRLKGLPGELEELQKRGVQLHQAGSKEYAAVQRKVNDLRKERHTYEKAARNATNNILVHRKEIARSRVTLSQVVPLYDVLQEFSSDMELLQRSLELYKTGPYNVVNPEQIKHLHTLSEEAKTVLTRLDESVDSYANEIVKSVPSRIGAGIDTDIGDLVNMTPREVKASQASDQRRKVAKDYAKTLREHGSDYLA